MLTEQFIFIYFLMNFIQYLGLSFCPTFPYMLDEVA